MSITEWRSKRLNRRCRFCKHCRYHFHDIGSYSECIAKDKVVRDNVRRPFCSLFEVNTGDIIVAKIPCPPVSKLKETGI